MGLHLHAHKTRFTHTLTPYEGQVGFDFLGFHIRQEPVGNSHAIPSERRISAAKNLPENRGRPLSALRARPEWNEGVTGRPRPARQEHSLKGKTIIAPSQEASKRHLAAIDQRLQQL